MKYIVNGRTYGDIGSVTVITYKKLLKMTGQPIGSTITFRKTDGGGGSLLPQFELLLEEGMIFNVMDTSRA